MGGTNMLIDWLTIRYPLDESIGKFVFQKVSECLGRTYCVGANDELKWVKNNLDLDKLRSDSQGLYWSVTCDGDSRRYLTVGASPASLEFGGLNVFGSFDIEYTVQNGYDTNQVFSEADSPGLHTVLPPMLTHGRYLPPLPWVRFRLWLNGNPGGLR
jgi:hypothetical protein